MDEDVWKEGEIPAKVIVSGASGDRGGDVNGIYVWVEALGSEPAFFQKQAESRLWLYLSEDPACWCVGPEEAKAARSATCIAHSAPISRADELPHEVTDWEVLNSGQWYDQAVLVVPAPKEGLQGAIESAWRTAVGRAQEQPILVVTGATGHQAGFINGLYDMLPPDNGGQGPLYRHQQDPKRWLFVATDDKWWFAGSASKDTRKPAGQGHSDVIDPGTLPDGAQRWTISTKEGFMAQTLKILGREKGDIEASLPVAWQEVLVKVKAQPVVDIRGATGQNAEWINGEFELKEDAQQGPGAPPFAFKQRPPRAGASEFWLFLAKDGAWCIGPKQAMQAREPQGIAISARCVLGVLPPAAEHWRVITKPGTAEVQELTVRGFPGIKDFWATRIDRWRSEEDQSFSKITESVESGQTWHSQVREWHKEMSRQLTRGLTRNVGDPTASLGADDVRPRRQVVVAEAPDEESEESDLSSDDGMEPQKSLVKAQKKVYTLERKTKKVEMKVKFLEESPCQLEEISQDNDLYRDVERMFREQGMLDCHIRRIQKTHMQEKHVKAYEANRRQKEERMLWFGTSVFDPKKVLQSEHGMDYRYSSFGKLGRGLYGAELAGYSDSCFAYEDQNCQRSLVLFRGIVGNKFDYTKAPTAPGRNDWPTDKSEEQDPLTRTLKKSRTYSAPPKGFDSVYANQFCQSCLSVKPGEVMSSKCTCPWTPHEYQPELYSQMLGLEGDLALKRRRVAGPIVCLYPPRDFDCDPAGDSQPWADMQHKKAYEMQPYALAIPICLVEYVRSRSSQSDSLGVGKRYSLHKAHTRLGSTMAGGDGRSLASAGTYAHTLTTLRLNTTVGFTEDEAEEPIWRVWYNNTMEKKKAEKNELSLLEQEIEGLTRAMRNLESRLDIESEDRKAELIEAKRCLQALRDELTQARRRRDLLEDQLRTATDREDTNEGDVCQLAEVSEASLVTMVHQRYLKNRIYTRADRTVIAVNPFQALAIYSSQVMDRYSKASNSLELPPHIFSVAFDALQGLRATGRNQAILISGESGAGKTESKKLVLSFVSEAIGGGEGWSRVLSSLPIVEAFGNAMTVRNNNSSRFGKWVDLCFTQSCDFKICAMTSYLLELTRVCAQERNERGYHVFFEIIQAGIIPEFEQLGCKTPHDFEYLRQGQVTAPGIDDAQDFQCLKQALQASGMTEEEQRWLFRVVAGVLTLGNCALRPAGDGTKLESEAPAVATAKLWDIDLDELQSCFLTKNIMVGKESVTSPLRMDQAKAARDTLARKTYGQLFSWIFSRINSTFGSDAEACGSYRELGVLDLAGFECFEHNSLEQLLINFGNERLQQRFNEVMFSQEMKQCEEEGVPAPSNLGFVDNSDAVEFLDKIVTLLNETMTMQKPSEEAYMGKVRTLSGNKRLTIPKVQGVTFGVAHFAGEVWYNCSGWLEKNASHASASVATMLASSSNGIAKELGEAMSEPTNSRTMVAAKKKKTVTEDFRDSMKALLQKVANADTHYIRCVKPNYEKVPNRFDDDLVREQLLRSGVLTLVKIRQQGYSHRLPHREFFNRFGRCVLWRRDGMPRKPCPSPAPPTATDAEVKCLVESVVEAMKQQGMEAAVIGKRRVFVRMSSMRALEEVVHLHFSQAVISLQCIALTKATQRRFEVKRNVIREIEHSICSAGVPLVQGSKESLRQWDRDALLKLVGSKETGQALLANLKQLFKRAAELHVDEQHFKLAGPMVICKRLEKELEAVMEAEAFVECLDAVTLERLLARGRSLHLEEVSVFPKLMSQLKKIRIQHELVSAMAAALDEENEVGLEQLKDIVAEVEEAGLVAAADWLPDFQCGPAMMLQQLVNKKNAMEQAAAARKAKSGPVVDKVVEPEASEVGRRKSLEAMRRQSFKAMGPQGMEALWEDLRRAAAELNVTALQRALRRAELCSMPEDFPRPQAAPGASEKAVAGEVVNFGQARSLYAHLQDEQFLLRELQRARTEMKDRHPPLVTLQRLENLSECLAQLKQTDAAAAARHCVQKELMWRSKNNGVSSVFEVAHPEELALATKVFCDLTNFAGIKKGSQRPSIRPSSGKMGRRWSLPSQPALAESTPQSLSFSSTCLPGAITQVPEGMEAEAFEQAAVELSRDILQCMGDRFGSSAQIRSSMEAVLTRAVEAPLLRDEIYVQLLKQLDKNPSAASARRGWELLRRLCQESPPIGELAEFVRHFLRSGGSFAGPLGSEAAGLARICLEAVGQEALALGPGGAGGGGPDMQPRGSLKGARMARPSVTPRPSTAATGGAHGDRGAVRSVASGAVSSRVSKRPTLGGRGTLGPDGEPSVIKDPVVAARLVRLEDENKELRAEVARLRLAAGREAEALPTRLLAEQRTSGRCWFGCRG